MPAYAVRCMASPAGRPFPPPLPVANDSGPVRHTCRAVALPAAVENELFMRRGLPCLRPSSPNVHEEGSLQLGETTLPSRHTALLRRPRRRRRAHWPWTGPSRPAPLPSPRAVRVALPTHLPMLAGSAASRTGLPSPPTPLPAAEGDVPSVRFMGPRPCRLLREGEGSKQPTAGPVDRGVRPGRGGLPRPCGPYYMWPDKGALAHPLRDDKHGPGLRSSATRRALAVHVQAAGCWLWLMHLTFAATAVDLVHHALLTCAWP
jgi:hypothetical protein